MHAIPCTDHIHSRVNGQDWNLIEPRGALHGSQSNRNRPHARKIPGTSLTRGPLGTKHIGTLAYARERHGARQFLAQFDIGRIRNSDYDPGLPNRLNVDPAGVGAARPRTQVLEIDPPPYDWSIGEDAMRSARPPAPIHKPTGMTGLLRTIARCRLGIRRVRRETRQAPGLASETVDTSRPACRHRSTIRAKSSSARRSAWRSLHPRPRR